MIHTNRWYPDTCGCVIDYSWDDSKEGSPVFKSTIKTCEAHKHLSGSADHYSTLLEENRRKNKAIEIATKKFTLTAWEDFGFSFNEDRSLNIQAGKLTVEQKEILQEEVNIKIGFNKVRIS